MLSSKWFQAELSSVSEARRWVIAQLVSWGLDRYVHDVALCVSELVANVLAHVGGRFRVELGTDDGSVRVSVHDADPTPPVLRRARPDDVCGRGLFIVDALAARWGVQVHGTGKSVWFDLC